MNDSSGCNRLLATVFAGFILLVAACQPAPQPAPADTPAATATPESISPTLTPTHARPTRTPAPTRVPGLFGPAFSYQGPLDLVEADIPRDECEQESPFELPADNLVQVAFVPNGICFNGELGLLEIGDRLYVAQSGTFFAAFTLIDVTDPSQPEIVGAWEFKPIVYGADLKTFRQGGRPYIAIGMEAPGFDPPGSEPCGIAIIEMSDPREPKLIDVYHGQVAGAEHPWCNVHTLEIDTGENGDGNYMFVTSNDTADLRVIDIRDLSQPREVNRYIHPEADARQTFVHDSTIAGDRVYIAYWDGGLVIVDKAQIESGEEVTPLNEPGSIDPDRFWVHHSYPTTGGGFVFIEDEMDDKRFEISQLQLWDIRDLEAPKQALAVELGDPPMASPHNLLVDGDRLYVGWYQAGVRVFRFDVSDPDNPVVEPAGAQPVRARRGFGPITGPYDGVWGVRTHACQIRGRATMCVYASDLTRGLIILALP